MKDQRSNVLALLRMKGPVTPRDIGKELGMDTTFAGAYLSELSASKELKVTHVKHGSTPLYYLVGQEEKLQDLDKYLNEKDKRAYDLIKLQKVLADKKLSPLLRVSLRNIKDFAMPLNVKINGTTELFWKWYLASNEDVSGRVKAFFTPNKKPEAKPKTEENPTEKVQETNIKKEEPKVTEKPIEVIKQVKEKEIEPILKIKEQQIEAKKPELKKETHKETIQETKPIIKEPTENIQQKTLTESDLPWYQQQLTHNQISKFNDEFLLTILAYFKDKNIEITSLNIAKKKSDIELIVEVPSVVGKIKYYCRARNKKRCNDGDISSAYVQAMIQKLPALFLTPGDLTKKAQQMLETDLKNHVISKKLE